jgi:hypothetical protein
MAQMLGNVNPELPKKLYAWCESYRRLRQEELDFCRPHTARSIREGPEDLSHTIPSIEAHSPGKGQSKQGLNEGIKWGCRASMPLLSSNINLWKMLTNLTCSPPSICPNGRLPPAGSFLKTEQYTEPALHDRGSAGANCEPDPILWCVFLRRA